MNSLLNFWHKNPLLLAQRPLNCVKKESSGKLDSLHKVDNWEKRFLVWTGKYKNIEEVPAFVGQAMMERARNRMRIKIANYMMLATILGCLGMVYLGKQDAKEGKTLVKKNIDWHKEQSNKDKS